METGNDVGDGSRQTRTERLLASVRGDFVGLDTEYALADGRRSRRRFLDSAASTLMMRPAQSTARSFLEHYSNTHSFTHFSARVSTEAYRWAHRRVLSFFSAPADEYACVFMGSGSTACLNRVSRIFRGLRPGRDTTLVSLMEHHSNDLPHRKRFPNVLAIPLEGEGRHAGRVDLAALETLLDENAGRVAYVAVTAASNVTGIINPIHDIAEMAHAHGTFVVVDASQIAPHRAVNVGGSADRARNLDAIVFSGHKVYAPGSPGALVIRKDLLEQSEPTEMGGGMVERVSSTSYEVSSEPTEREEAGTPNIVGAVTLASALHVLQRIGMDLLSREEEELARRLVSGLLEIPEVTVYGDTDLDRCPRTPTVSLNVRGIEHGLLAAVLNDYFNIAVRNECFCAHPYVRSMLLEELWDVEDDDEEVVKSRQGRVRVSLGLYNTEEDVDAFLSAIRRVVAGPELYRSRYEPDGKGGFRHREIRTDGRSIFDPQATLDALLDERIGGSSGECFGDSARPFGGKTLERKVATARAEGVDSDPRELIAWAYELLGDRLMMSTAFGKSGMVLLHMVKDVCPALPIYFLDTGFHFEETGEFARFIRDEWGLRLTIRRPRLYGAAFRETYGTNLHAWNPDFCCHKNKVEPFAELLKEYEGWITGIRRDQSPSRADAQSLEILGDGRLKVQPLVEWTRQDVEAYLESHDIPLHPLFEKGYASIGCAPCTRPCGGNADERAGRWMGQQKNECGLHVFWKNRGGTPQKAVPAAVAAE